ncbi:FGGY-family carbohydrate kinase [Leifsonia sp. SIMBA_070]|uniref:FGGY-family carbohydrate kinase n=3 Tax=Bacillati TaxID=1783272 RepID=UPI00397E31FF
MIFVGVDIGTTRTKALLYDAATGERRVVARATPVRTSAAGDLRDADAVLATVVDAVGGALSGLDAADRSRVRGLGVTSLSEEMVLLGADGRSLGPMPAWYNRGAGGPAAAQAGLDPSFSWAKLRWAHDELAGGRSSLFPGVFPDDVAGIATLNGYIAAQLAGSGRPVVDHSHASRTGFFDVREARWLPDVFAATGWAPGLLPELVPTGRSVGTLQPGLAERWDVPATAEVVLAGHDHFCGAYGIGLRGGGGLYISAGTSEAHCLILDWLPDGELPDGVGVGRFVDGRRFYLHAQLPSGHLYRHWTGLLGLDALTPDEEAAELARRPIGSDGTVLLPGSGTDLRSHLLDVAAPADGPTILRALYEGLACAALQLDRDLTVFAGVQANTVLAAGVPCSSPVWREARAQLSDAPLAVSTETEAPALGAAVLAQLATTGVAAPPEPAVAVEVDSALQSAYTGVYQRYLRARHRVAS